MNKRNNPLKRYLALLLAAVLSISTVDLSAFAQTISGGDETGPVEMTTTTDTGSGDGNDEMGTETTFNKEDILALLNHTKSYEINTSIDSRWDGGYTGTITIKNTGETIIDNWYLRLTHKDNITNIWNASIVENTEGELLIKNAAWNQDIAPGGTVSFGYQAQYEEEIHEPEKPGLCGTWQETEKENYDTACSVTNSWEEIHLQADVSIKNTGESTLEDWVVSFAYENEITQIWNGEILARQEGYYLIKNAGHNQNIAAGSNVSFGFLAEGNPEAVPKDLHLYTVVPASREDSPEGEDSVAPGDEAETDSDNDNIPDDREAVLGFDPAMEDTDGDGLPDGYEIYTLYPLLLDSDYPEEGGINPEDDYDKDGLTNLEEYHLGTNPGLADTEGDRLGDCEEVTAYGTDPLLMDSDEDGLCDGTEVEAGFDPTDPDTDKDSIKDGEEIITQILTAEQTEESAVIPTLQITGAGDYHEKLEITERQDGVFWEGMDFLAGEAYEFAHGQEPVFENAVLTFHLTEEALEKHNLVDLSIAWYDETNGIFELLDTTYDKDTKTIQAEVEHFSTYVVLNKKTYYSNLCTGYTEELPQIYEYDGHGYALLEPGRSWNEAVEYCESLGGKLVVINDEKEQQFLTELLKEKQTRGTYYIGLSGTNNQYSWIDGTPLVYTNWSEGEPNNVREHVVHMYAVDYGGYAYVGEWNDTYNYATSVSSFYLASNCGIICEFDGERLNGNYPVVLSDGRVVYLKADPSEFNETVDTDEDGIPDMVELGEQITLTIPENYGMYGKPSSYKEVTAWTYRSNPAEKDTDGDGYEDGNDPYPKRFDLNITAVYDENEIELNSDSRYHILAQDVKKFYELYRIRYVLPNREELEETKLLLDENRRNHYTSDEVTLFCLIDENGVKDYMRDKYLYFWREVYQKVTGEEGANYEVIDFFEINRIGIEWDTYLADAVDQIVRGKYSDKCNLLGTLGELGLAFVGVDIVQDFRDFTYDITYWDKEWEENGWLHVGGTALDGAGMLPVIGMVAVSDEAYVLLKNADHLFSLKRIPAGEILQKIEQTKAVEKLYQLADTAGMALNEMSAALYRNVLNTCHRVSDYRMAYAGGYGNVVLDIMAEEADDLEYLARIDSNVAKNTVEEIAEASGKSAEEISSIAKKKIELSKAEVRKLVDERIEMYENTVINQTKVRGTYSGESNSQILKKEMESAGLDIHQAAPYEHCTHHIVPAEETYPSAIRAREILAKYDIDVNAATNGVLLPYGDWDTALGATVHRGRHTEAYCNKILNMLDEAEDAEEVVTILNKIRVELLKGELNL